MVILDTHARLFRINDSINLLGKKALKSIKKESVLGVSKISCWEAGMPVNEHRITLNTDIRDWIERALTYPKIELIDLSP